MAQHNNIGVYQLPNGNWAYRFTQTVNGKRHNHKSVKDENGEPMKRRQFGRGNWQSWHWRQSNSKSRN